MSITAMAQMSLPTFIGASIKDDASILITTIVNMALLVILVCSVCELYHLYEWMQYKHGLFSVFKVLLYTYEIFKRPKFKDSCQDYDKQEDD